ncbi:MAG TPA: aminotransferase class I/II-fold pyridoxal phosphate-dependent enzyme [Bryobacteraceae bacterium]|nr:aminotransferase class I/II-fold pyridoxal phosphate-dependent enzyme [Bryobacteraceae bacterium]
MNPELEFSPERMREIGYRVIDRLVEHLTTLSTQPVGAKADPSTLIPAFSQPPPEEGTDFETVLAQLEQQVFRHTMHVNHPRFLAYVPGPGNFVGAMADALASGYNVFAGTWISGSGPAAVELAVVDWLRQACGFPSGAGGLFVSGGTMANLTALAVARHVTLEDRLDGATVYFSDQAHSSLEKALFLLGISPANFRRLPSDGDFRLPLGELARSIEQDRASGLRPFCVIATAGTTNTGAIDPLADLASLCHAENLWLHVDGAYGAAAALSRRGRDLLRGIELADSLSLDPHKWLFQPFEIGCVLVRDLAQLRDTFRILPEYLKDTHQRSEDFNFTDYGLQLTRSFRALKLWMSIQVFGMASFRAAIERGFVLAEFTEACLGGMPGWEIVTPANMAVVCFRYSAGSDAFHLRLVQALLDDGSALITSTVLRGRTVLRACTINPRSTQADIRTTLERLDFLAQTLAPAKDAAKAP